MTRPEHVEQPAPAMKDEKLHAPRTAKGAIHLGAKGLMVRACWNDTDIMTAALEAQRRGVALESWLQNVIRAGVAAVRVASSGADLAQVERLINTLTQRVETSVTGSLTDLTTQVARLSDPADGDLARASQAAVDRLAYGVQKLLLGEQAVLPETVRAAVRGVTEQALAEIQRSFGRADRSRSASGRQ